MKNIHLLSTTLAIAALAQADMLLSNRSIGEIKTTEPPQLFPRRPNGKNKAQWKREQKRK